ncbi:MAG: metallophosphoesterase family protein, partial [Anaerolineae bacterium]|nr:metallophosphoesterase family protein [Anaerolineae bacterium]
MKIAVLSDVHDNIWKLEKLLASLEADALVFCGDFCAPFTLAQIAEGFGGPVHVV